MEEYQGESETHRPYIYFLSDHFTLVLPDLTYMDGVEDSNVPVLTFVPVPKGTDYDAKVLSFCYFLFSLYPIFGGLPKSSGSNAIGLFEALCEVALGRKTGYLRHLGNAVISAGK